jgi:hypothetical protein
MPEPWSTGRCKFSPGWDSILFWMSGLDMTNFNQPRFYETQQDKLPSYLANKVDDRHAVLFARRQVLQQNHIRVLIFPRKRVPETIFEKVF